MESLGDSFPVKNFSVKIFIVRNVFNISSTRPDLFTSHLIHLAAKLHVG